MCFVDDTPCSVFYCRYRTKSHSIDVNPLLCAVTEVPENIFLLTDCPHDWLFPQCAAVVHLSSHLLGKQFWGLQCKLLHSVQILIVPGVVEACAIRK